MKVLIDTNGLMVPGQRGIDIFDELRALGYDEFVVPSAVTDEMEVLKRKVKGEDRAALAIAGSLLRQCEIVDAPGEADEVLLRLALETHAPVFTNDAVLRKRLKKEQVRTIFVRSRQKLAIE